MLLRRIVLLYIVLLLCRIVFYCYNYALIGPLGWQEVLTLAGGGLKFDTVSVVYADGVFILLSLVPRSVSPPTKSSSPTTPIRHSSC